MKSPRFFLFAAGLAFFAGQFCRADNTAVDWFNVNGGGGTVSGGLASISGSIGQSDAGEMSAATASFLDGFWSVADPALTSLALRASANPAPAGSGVTFTATLSADADIQPPGGLVQFLVDGSPFGSPVDLTNGSANLTTDSLSIGLHGVSADYAGDDNFLVSSISLSPEESIDAPLPAAGGVVVRVNTPGEQANGTITAAVSNPNSVKAGNLSLQSLVGGVRLMAGGTPGHNYQLQYSDSLAPANWQNLSSPFVMPDTGSMATQVSVGNASRYFRVVPSP